MSSGTIVASTEMTDQEASPEPASGNDSIFGSEHPDDQQSADDSTGPNSVKAEHDEENGSASNSNPSMPMQKRRRVTRACDECRRKKIKCDGKQPCTHCSVYSYECTYDKPSNRRRNPAPQYIEALEAKLIRAEALLRKFVPNVDLNDPHLDPSVQQEFQNRERQRVQAAKQKRDEAHQTIDQNEARITSMIETIGQLDLDEGGGWDFRGTSSGAVFLRRMKEHFGGLLGNDQSMPFLPRPSHIQGLLKLDPPGSIASPSSPGEADLFNVYDLPSKERAKQLSSSALTCATALLRIVHVPSFSRSMESIYSKSSLEFGVDDNRFLALFYAVMAVGAMYNMTEEDSDDQASYKEAAAEGMKYYTCARTLLQDITECRDLTSLQALLFLILFLQSTSNLSGCYALLGIASRAALRMGLHRHLPQANFTPLVTELRRRIFYFIRQLDIYCSALLGFPILLHDEDVDQKMPTEIDDEFITDEGIRKPPPGTPGSFFQAFNAHSRLMGILMKVVKYIYPLKGIESYAANSSNPTYMIEYRRIKEIENDLQVWHEQLPQRWRPSPEGSIEVMRVRTLLRFAYAHVQMMLYRPFLHYISPRLATDKTVDERYYACAAAGISVSRNILHLSTEIKNQALVVGPFWSMLYTEFFAILTLVFYVLENPDKPGSAEIFADANAGREMIKKMAARSFAADRICKSMDSLWEKLPETVKSGKGRPLASRKRSAPGARPGPAVLSAQKPMASSSRIVRGKSLDQRASIEDLFGVSPQQAMSINYGKLHGLDVSSTGSDKSVVPSTAHSSSSAYMRSSQTQQSPSIYKLDALMFPSSDPFAYPNQPLADFGTQVATHAERQPPLISNMHGQHPTDSRNYYMPEVYGDIEGQLIGGPLPQYLMQNNLAPNGMDLSAQLYQSSSALGMHQSQPHHTAALGHHSHHHQHAQHHRAVREMDDMMADSGFNRSWDMFGGNFKPL
ncbi:Gypsy retrotransposon integrase-like protein 1 [Gnomoniopsis smithogilvyi]|uniref:Gypsy retrotransposon integrase-like protein 1 n=1 Tax=Gnomoniopsis smithogilvyi TaxID=1191159 RepID=A0A9W8YWT7_9PEZI|nr:Gypsy retrotransposon integrase-like protein 1 [Gnomoniopsis smithogilvyi]